MTVRRPLRGLLLLFAGFVVAAAIGAVAALGVRAVGDTTKALYLHPFQVSNAVLEARYQITALHRSMRELLLASNPAERRVALDDMAGRLRQAEAGLGVAQRFYLGDATEVTVALADLARWDGLRRRVAELAVAGRRDEARALMTGEAGQAFATLDSDIGRILLYARGRAATFAGSATRREAALIPAVVGLAALLGILLAVVFRSWRRTVEHDERAAAALAVSEERFRAAQEMSVDGFAIFRAVRAGDGRIVDFAWDYANAPALRICGTSAEAVRGSTLAAIMPHCMVPAGLFHRHRKVVETGLADVYETYLDCGPAAGWYRNMVVKLGDGVAVSFADVTDIKRARLAKSHFLASVSHDLRQPLQALRLFVDVLDHQVDGPARRAVTGAAQALAAAEQLLIALLDVSRLDAGMVEPSPGPVDLAPLLAQLVDECAVQALQAGIAFRLQPCTAVVRSDPVLLARILRNLLHNALRYTADGRILLGARRAGDAVRIEVWDSGPGIPPGETDAIFEDFYQLGNPARDRTQGLGLGLAIVRRNAELLGHSFGVRSIPGRGSVFWVTVPRIGPEAGGGDSHPAFPCDP